MPLWCATTLAQQFARHEYLKRQQQLLTSAKNESDHMQSFPHIHPCGSDLHQLGVTVLIIICNLLFAEMVLLSDVSVPTDWFISVLGTEHA